MSIRSYTGVLLLVAAGGMLVLGVTSAVLQRGQNRRADALSAAATSLRHFEALVDDSDRWLAALDAIAHSGPDAPDSAAGLLDDCREDIRLLSQDSQLSRAGLPAELNTILNELARESALLRSSNRPIAVIDPGAADFAALTGRFHAVRNRLQKGVSAAVERASQDLTKNRISWTWLIGGMGILYFLALLVAQHWVSKSVAGPMRSLGQAAHHAMVNQEPFTHTALGPREVQELTGTISSFVASLESRANDRTAEQQSLNTNLRLVNATLQKEVALRKAAETRLRHDALHDALTQLPNRHLIMDRLRFSMDRARRDAQYGFAVLFLDLDNFKIVNDSLGHRVGDDLLVEVGKRLGACLRTLDMISHDGDPITGRLGGDEFVILLDGVQSEHDAILVAERIQEQLSLPVHLEGHPIGVSASIGIALHSGETTDPEEFLRDADTAMYRAKQAGKMQHAVFNKTMHVAAKSRLKLENELRLALDRNEFALRFQPIVALDSGEISAFEALLRWKQPDGRIGQPSDFITIAEETGLIIPIGRWALKEACRTLRTWHDQLPAARSISINVNIAKRQVLAPDFCDDLEGILGETGLQAAWVNLELTESTVIEVSARLPTVLQRVKQLGFRLHMDDFGTGYSSLSCLHDLPIDVLKIDRSFVGTMGTNRDYTAIVYSILTLARHLNMRVVAEGIEHKEDLASLLALDCDFGQGFYFSKPVDQQQAQKLILAGGKWLKPSSPVTALAATSRSP